MTAADAVVSRPSWALVRRGAARVRGFVVGHPLTVVAALSTLSAIATLVVIWHRRTVGTFDPDEAGYLATALRYQRSIDPSAPLQLWREIRATDAGPLVPLLSVVTLILGPRDPRSAMAIEAVLLVFTAVAAAGISRRLTGPGFAVLAGLAVAGSTEMVAASQSYWFGLGTAAAMAGSVWALVSSDRLGNRWTWAFGVGTGLMLLARTMSIAFVPGLVVAGAVLAWGDRRRLLRLGGAFLLAALVAGPWWFARRHQIWDYLSGYGYGASARNFGDTDVTRRLVQLPIELLDHAWLPLPIILPVVVGIWVRRRQWWSGRGSAAFREAAAIGIVVISGMAALISSANHGIWFDLPLAVLVVPLVAGAAARTPRPSRIVLAGFLAFGALYGSIRERVVPVSRIDYVLGDYDRRYTVDGPAYARAARAWWAVDRRLADDLARWTHRGRTGIVAMTGNTTLVNQNSLTLASEMDQWSPVIEVPDTTASIPARLLLSRSDQLEADGTPKERFLVIVRQQNTTFPPDVGWRRFEREARRTGWRTVSTIRLPLDGQVVILRKRGAE